MSVVIIGGHERMECKYKSICKQYNCKAKVFTKKSGKFGNQIGCPDLMILFMNTVSHRMVKSAMSEAEKNHVEVIKCLSSSGSALEEALTSAVSVQ